jgi:hypothetical protein
MKPNKGKAVAKEVNGKKVSFGQAGKTPKPGTAKGDAYCARSAGQMKKYPEAAKDPSSPLRLSRARWKCKGKKSSD